MLNVITYVLSGDQKHQIEVSQTDWCKNQPQRCDKKESIIIELYSQTEYLIPLLLLNFKSESSVFCFYNQPPTLYWLILGVKAIQYFFNMMLICDDMNAEFYFYNYGMLLNSRLIRAKAETCSNSSFILSAH